MEALGFRSIGRFLGVSNVTVLNWIRSFGEEVKILQAESQHIDFVELNEMHSYIGNKKTIVGYGLLLIDMGSNSLISFSEIRATDSKRFWNEIKHHQVRCIASEHWQVPLEKHIQTKAENVYSGRLQ